MEITQERQREFEREVAERKARLAKAERRRNFVIAGAICLAVAVLLATGSLRALSSEPECPSGYSYDVVGEDRLEGDLYACVKD